MNIFGPVNPIVITTSRWLESTRFDDKTIFHEVSKKLITNNCLADIGWFVTH